MKKTLFLLALGLMQSLLSFGFGGMGNTSAGLGDSGVALRKSAWGIYYNPALLASDNRGKFGYSVGATLDERGLGDVAQAFLNGGSVNINDLYNRFQSHPRHSIHLTSQNGFVIQITGGTHEVPEVDEKGEPTGNFVLKRNPYGAFTMAAFFSGYSYGNLNATLNTSAASMQVDGSLSAFTLLEAPIGWGWKWETDVGDVSFGASIKYMGLSAFDLPISMTISNQESNFTLPRFGNLEISHWFGVDLGLLYSPIESVHIGFVAKNINVPTFSLLGKDYKILPQFRFGLSYEFAKYFVLTFDADLAPNHILFDNSPKTQMLGGGLLMDFYWVDLRFGLMGDMANQFEQGVIMTGGINLLGFLDIAIQASSEMFDLKGYKVPNYMAVKIGGSFTF